jgi:hypothetical protein
MLNTHVRDNLLHLSDRPFYQVLPNIGGTTTNSGTWNDVHTDLKFNIVHPSETGFQRTYLVGFSGMFKVTSLANSYRIGLSFNGSNDADYVHTAPVPVVNAAFPIALTVVKSLGSGSHNVAANWLIGGGHTLEAVGSWRLWALEIAQAAT